MSRVTGPRLYRYGFRLPDGADVVFDVRLDPDTLANLDPVPEILPEWTQLDFCRCDDCPLAGGPASHCPPAVRLVRVVRAFREMRSFDQVEVRVEGPNRTFLATTDLQRGASGLIGLIMTTAGCPVLDRLRPLVETHLPFMSEEESTFRLIAGYLLAQYFRQRAGLEADWKLEELTGFFDRLQQVNSAFLDRLRSVPMRDASANAVVILNNLGALAGLSITRDKLDRLERLHALAEGR